MSYRKFLAVLTLAAVVPALASDLSDDVGRVQHADVVFQQVMKTPDQAIPQEVLEGAQCIAIVPSEKTFAIGFGGTYGKGIATCRNRGAWSAPMFIEVGGGSWGLQLGGQSTDVIMIFRSRDGMDSLLRDKVKLGGSASAAAGPVGRHATADTDLAMQAEILGYSRSRGAFAGISLNGDVVQPDDSGNTAMYGSHPWKEILAGNVAAPSSTRPLLRTLNRYSAVSH
ncbi:MAG TPA: lipid-binding SYLF domain-containing protein [Terriglobales bacterium]|nr:lipid-binding SYLF domain-containing protein [Terriglobales bacterium]